MDRPTAIFVDGIGAAAATSGVLNQLQGRIFGLLYMEGRALSLDDIAEALEQSKSNVSVNIRGLTEWHLVRRSPVGGSRKDHYEAATDFWRVMQEIMERRFRWNIRQVIAACEETQRSASGGKTGPRKADPELDFIEGRLEALRSFAAAVEAGIEAFSRGEAIAPAALQKIPIERSR